MTGRDSDVEHSKRCVFSGRYNLKKQKQKMRRKQLRPWDEHSSPKTRSENEGGAADEEGPGGSCGGDVETGGTIQGSGNGI